jgi:parallel beta-helix repeat protein
MKKAVKGLISIGIIIVFLIGSVSAKDCGDGIAPCDCGDTVVSNWTFTSDITCPAGHGLIIGSDGITIDGKGYTITGSAQSCGYITETDPSQGYCGIYNPGYDNIVIKNLEVETFCNGIALHGTGSNPVVSNSIDNCNIHHNGNSTDGKSHGIHACFVSECIISNNDLHHNTGIGDACGDGGNGIFLYAGHEEYKGNIITKNVFHENRKGGFFAKMMLQHAEITQNHAYANGQGGIILRCKKSSNNLIENNNASKNYGDGIFIGGKNNTISKNIVENNMAGFKISSTDVVGDGDGIDMGRSDGSFGNKLHDNTVCGNEDMDIDTFGPDSGTIGNENTCETTDYYNDEDVTGCSYSCIDPEELARMLTSQGWMIYGTSGDEWCIKQKEVFGDAFRNLNYINCDENEEACINANIKNIPCWISPNKTHYSGYYDLNRLSELTKEYHKAVSPSENLHGSNQTSSGSNSLGGSVGCFELILTLIVISIVLVGQKGKNNR